MEPRNLRPDARRQHLLERSHLMIDERSIANSAGLSTEQWHQLSQHDRADLTEFAANANADILRTRLTVHEGTKQWADHEDILQTLDELTVAWTGLMQEHLAAGINFQTINQFLDAAMHHIETAVPDETIYMNILDLREQLLGYLVRELHSWEGKMERPNYTDVMQQLRSAVAEQLRSNRLVPKADVWHDWVHYVGGLRETGGQLQRPRFLEVGDKESYLEPAILDEELYPSLFLTPAVTIPGVNFAMLVTESKLREQWTIELRKSLEFSRLIKNQERIAVQEERLAVIAEPVPESMGGRIQVYEHLLQLQERDHYLRKYGTMPPAQDQALSNYYKDLKSGARPRPEYYLAAAEKLLSGKHIQQPTVFSEELLEAIRSHKK